MSNGCKVLLINPPHTQAKGSYPKVVFEPLGLAYVGAYLEMNGYEVRILDTIVEGFDKTTDIGEGMELVGLTFEEVGDFVRQVSPQVVGIGAPFTMRADNAFATAAIVKKIDKNIVTVLGGMHPSSNPEECLEHPDVDYIVAGDGEVPMLNIVRSVEKGDLKSIEGLKGIGHKSNGTPVVNERMPPVVNLDELPFPARHLLPMEKYFEASRAYKSARQGKRFVSIITSRGCPFSCAFCIAKNVMGRVWRYRSPENVVDEIEDVVKEYGISFIHFEDDNLTLNKERIKRICDLILERKLKIKWDAPNGIMAHTVDVEALSAMKKSGCDYVAIAPESGNQYVLNNLVRKKVSLQKYEEAVIACKKVGIRVDASFIIGLAGETKEQIEDTLEFARKLRRLGISRNVFHIAIPFEGSELYEVAMEKGYLVKPGEGSVQVETFRIATPEFTVQDIDRYFMEANKINPAIPMDKLGQAWYLLFRNPIKLMKAAFNCLRGQSGTMSGQVQFSSKRSTKP